jgi:hypothetical protein
VQVHHDEGVANRIDPESCADTREGIGEALTGERIGQPLSRESTLIPGADVVPVTEGNTDGRDNASAHTSRGRRSELQGSEPARRQRAGSQDRVRQASEYSVYEETVRIGKKPIDLAVLRERH